MTFSLYDAVVPNFRQTIGAAIHILGKAEAWASEQGKSAEEVIGYSLAPDMLPLGYQVKCLPHHSIGGIDGVRAGQFSPDMKPWPTDFAGLKALLQGADEKLAALTAADLEALQDQETAFVFGETRMPFTGANFLLSFSTPNFYFHATTFYDILRSKGVALGKRDFMGRPRLKL
ncbi:DUF1993 domain-containing protein [Sandaracinobacteroides hominis]|uniref:DUF1993 domain-containing protein n=1 Tax=Sandaracinobacteroides hominis TaxID=2780086 RepID=UPI0018F707AB|nr:DUF1993 domain-containing protein [Sandaracinobacteroides hominis]